MAPPLTQVYFHQQQQRSQSDTGSYLSTPSNTNYTDTSVNRDRQYNNETYYVSYNTTANTQVNDYLPEGTMSLHSLNVSVVSLFGLCLFDSGCSGSTSTLINEHAVSPRVHPKFRESQIVHVLFLFIFLLL